jgi:hypothetical protein
MQFLFSSVNVMFYKEILVYLEYRNSELTNYIQFVDDLIGFYYKVYPQLYAVNDQVDFWEDKKPIPISE